MIAPELLVTCPPPSSTSASPPPTLSCAPENMLTVTFVLPGCATIPVVTGFGWELSHVTVCPADGVSVGVQAARAGSAGQTSAVVVRAKAEAVERKRARKCRGPLTVRRSANRSERDADCIIDVSAHAAGQLAIRDDAWQCHST